LASTPLTPTPHGRHSACATCHPYEAGTHGPGRLSCLQRRVLAWLAQEAQRTWGTMAASDEALAHDQGNLSHSPANLEAKGLTRFARAAGGNAEAGHLMPAGCMYLTELSRSCD
jgi:hypothetical protein